MLSELSLNLLMLLALALWLNMGIQADSSTTQTYYIDCESGDDTHAGTSPDSAWRTAQKVNDTAFMPGDTILFKRGTVCQGALWPKGSGTADAPIVLGAYGYGSLPVIDGGQSEAALKLFDQEYWHLRELEITGGTKYGVLIGGRRSLRHFRLIHLVVHDVFGGPVQTKASGLVVFAPEGNHPVFDDIVVDGVTAYNTNQWGGIVVNGGTWPLDPDNPAFGTDVIVRNSTVHNVYGDGIVLWYVKNGLIEHSVAYDTGQQPSPQTIGTPNAIWTWACHDCTVQFNEAYRSASPEVDAGCFDIDWGTRNNIVQYNYGHDSDGYCLSVFGAEGFTTTNAVIRYNVCQNNARRPDLARRQGDVFVTTWNGGALDGVQIYNNTFYWNPAENAALLKNTATFQGENPTFFKNNLIYSTTNLLVESNRSLELDHNLYWVVSDQEREPFWNYGDGFYRAFADFQRGSRQEANGLYADPTLNEDETSVFLLPAGSPAIDAGVVLSNAGDHDAFQNPIPQDGAVNVGAYQGSADTSSVPVPAPLGVLGSEYSEYGGQVIVLGFVNAQADGSERDLSRSQIVFLKSIAQQYENIRVILVDTSGADEQTRIHAGYNWRLGAIPLLADSGGIAAAFAVTQSPTTVLIGEDGMILRRWDRFAAAQDLAFALQRVVVGK